MHPLAAEPADLGVAPAPLRIGVLTTSFPRSPDDIAGAFVLGMCRALSALGHRVEVLAPEPREQSAIPAWPGVTLTHVPYLRPRALQRTFYGAGVPDNLARDPLAWLGLGPFTLALTRAARARAQHWDALISHWALPCALAAAAARSGTSPHLAVLHSADVHALTRLPGRRRIAARIAAGADGLWFVSESQRRAFLDLVPTGTTSPPTTVCPMGVEPASPLSVPRAAARRMLGLERFSALVLSRLVPVKGIDIAIAAAAQSGATLLVAGAGPEGARLQSLAHSLRADVRFLGEVVGLDKTRLLTAADVLLVPSRRLPSGRSEGLPTVLLEAMLHGLPVIASDVGGIGALLREAGLGAQVIPADDPLALVRALRAPALTSETIEQARRFAASFAWPRVAKTMTTMLRGVVATDTS
jgi:glycosyltransferase involved in cell wall biosynthesis